eukprot:TRINITY_DN6386_c0_g3_i1.p1 TRINITY_DN6386_c0_g3~~TRINITY_DN6386_c0_g3_i1.p1  ORF type:complete len:295 (-),score=37.96 TRINITY_DN6386_c0_g3_i1:574-1458(-)
MEKESNLDGVMLYEGEKESVLYASKSGEEHYIIQYKCVPKSEFLTLILEDFAYLKKLQKICPIFAKPVKLNIKTRGSEILVQQVFPKKKEAVPDSKRIKELLSHTLDAVATINRQGLVISPIITRYCKSKPSICLIRSAELSLVKSWAIAVSRIIIGADPETIGKDVNHFKEKLISRFEDKAVESILHRACMTDDLEEFYAWAKKELALNNEVKREMANNIVQEIEALKIMGKNNSKYDAMRKELLLSNKIMEVLEDISNLHARAVNDCKQILHSFSSNPLLSAFHLCTFINKW